MSEITGVNITENQAQFNRDTSKIFVWNNRYSNGTFLNNSGAEASFAAGTLLGRVAASGKLVQHDPSATDGSQVPVGVLKTAVSDLANAGETEVNFCIAGDVVEDKVILKGAATMSTSVTVGTAHAQIIKDLIQGLGIKLVESVELTGFDNQ